MRPLGSPVLLSGVALAALTAAVFFAPPPPATEAPTSDRAEPARPRTPTTHVAAAAGAAAEPTGEPPADPLPATATVGSAEVAGTLVSARVVSAVIERPGAASPAAALVADDIPKRARVDQAVRLYALVAADIAGRRQWFSDAPQVRLAGKRLEVRPLAQLPRATLRWYRVEPEVATMSNTESGGFRFEPIPYLRTAIAGGDGQPSLAADVRPTLTPDHGHGVGTMRFAIELRRGGSVLASPGVEARRGRGSGGLLDTVHRVSIRRDDTYLGFLTEMFGQPYIWASAGTTTRAHQSERLEGSDCADFIIYGARRMGKPLEYTWSGGLPAVTKLLGRGERGEDGVYRDAAGEPLPFPAAGDLILFPRHVGALSQDRGQPGVLDDQDLMLHTLFDSPKEQAIADSGYAQTTVELRRWKR
jgi:hypothetical protein